MSAWSADIKPSVDDLRRLQLVSPQSLTIIDVRPPSDYAKGHIQGSLNIPVAKLSAAKLPDNANIIVYCGDATCPIADQAKKTISLVGARDVQTLVGGYAAWVKQGYPTQTGIPAPPKPKHNRTHAKVAKELIDQGQLTPIDTRPPDQYAAGHLPQARNIPLEQIDIHIPNLSKDSRYLVYDQQSSRSRQAHDKLKAAGLEVAELTGGLSAWVKKGNPLEVDSR
jgi:rhodanese-related sulfurtransferase